MTEPVRGMGLVLVLRHKLLCMHVFKGLLRCKSVCDVKPGLDPCPLLARSSKRRNAFRTGAMIYLSEKNILGLGAL